jgi:antitoxin HicB
MKGTREVNSRLEQYMALPYRVELVPDEDGWFVSIPDLPGCISQGTTPDEALEMIRDAQRLWLQTALEDGISIPEPGAMGKHSYSGKFNVRVPKSLHRDLIRAADAQGVSLNLYIATALAQSVGQKPPK